MWEVRRMAEVSTETAHEGLYKLAKTRASELKRLSKRVGAKPQDGRATRQMCLGVFTLIATRDLVVISLVTLSWT